MSPTNDVLCAGLLAMTILAPVTPASAQQQPPDAVKPSPASSATAKPAAASESDPFSSLQWVAASPSGGFPPPPRGDASTAPADQRQQSNFGPANYGAGATAPLSQDGMAPLPPLAPPGNLRQAEAIVSPFTPAEIVELRKQLDRSRQAKAYKPVRGIPRIGSLSVDLSPGASPPIVRTLPGEMSTLLFLDATGAPWPLAAAPRISDNRYFDPEWLRDSATVVISALSAYEEGNLVVMLQGLATPVAIKLVSGEPDSHDTTRVVDYRLDLRIPGRGPGAVAPLLGAGKIALYDENMQHFLDGLPPENARRLTPHGQVPDRTQVWQYDGALFVRTVHDIRTAFDQSIASGDGTHVYRLAPTPYVTLSELGRSLTMQLDLE